MVKPNTKFTLSVTDVDLIESALNGRVHRRSLSIAMDKESVYAEKMQDEVNEIRDLLGRLHYQKNWYTPKGKFQGGG